MMDDGSMKAKSVDPPWFMHAHCNHSAHGFSDVWLEYVEVFLNMNCDTLGLVRSHNESQAFTGIGYEWISTLR